MAYSVTLLNETTGDEHKIQVPEAQYIFDVAALEGIGLPASCREGNCIACAAKVVEGEVEHTQGTLSAEEKEAGFLLTCCAHAKSDCTILINQEETLLEFSPN